MLLLIDGKKKRETEKEKKSVVTTFERSARRAVDRLYSLRRELSYRAGSLPQTGFTIFIALNYSIEPPRITKLDTHCFILFYFILFYFIFFFLSYFDDAGLLKKPAAESFANCRSVRSGDLLWLVVVSYLFSDRFTFNPVVGCRTNRYSWSRRCRYPRGYRMSQAQFRRTSTRIGQSIVLLN